MARRTTPLLAYPEYVSADPENSVQTWGARRELIEAVKRVYPEFLRALSDEVFPFYDKLAKAGYDFDRILWSSQVSPYAAIRTCQDWHIANAPSPPREMDGEKKTQADEEAETEARAAIEADDFTAYQKAMNRKVSKVRNGWSRVPRGKDLEDLNSAVSEWATRFKVEDGWLVDEALRTLHGWSVAPEWRESLKWNTQYGHSGARSTGEIFEFRCEGWETESLMWCRYSDWVRQRFEERLLGYEKATRALAESCGLTHARLRYSTNNFDWFVLYQFAALSSTKIADQWSIKNDETGIDESTVLKGIKAAAKLIGWKRLTPHSERKETRKVR